MTRLSQRLSVVLVVASCLAIGSCGRYAGEASNPVAPSTSAVAETGTANSETISEHGHRAGRFGGVIGSLGRDEYHTEAVFQPGGVLALYILGADETRIHEVPEQVLTAYLQPQGESESLVMILQPDPLPGDAEAMTSRFSGSLPDQVRGQPFSVTVPGLRIDGERFAVRFDSPSPAEDPPMPAPWEDEQARKLYLSAGGLYTEADIQANGGMTAATKYAAFRANHNRHPQPGAAICPVTRTQANPKCSWVIGGKTYTFCCPPCIDEFLATAKQTPEEVLEPAAYVQGE